MREISESYCVICLAVGDQSNQQHNTLQQENSHPHTEQRETKQQPTLSLSAQERVGPVSIRTTIFLLHFLSLSSH